MTFFVITHFFLRIVGTIIMVKYFKVSLSIYEELNDRTGQYISIRCAYIVLRYSIYKNNFKGIWWQKYLYLYNSTKYM